MEMQRNFFFKTFLVTIATKSYAWHDEVWIVTVETLKSYDVHMIRETEYLLFKRYQSTEHAKWEHACKLGR